MKFINITGNRYNRLVVIERVESNKHGKAMWLCKCDCGNESIISGNNLRKGNTKSCGCLRNEKLLIAASKRDYFGKFNSNWKGGIYCNNKNAYKNAYWRQREAKKNKYMCSLTEAKMDKIRLYYQISEYLGPDWHVDHIIPISKGGLHHPDNLQIIPRKENLKKHNKLNYEVPEYMIFRI